MARWLFRRSLNNKIFSPDRYVMPLPTNRAAVFLLKNFVPFFMLSGSYLYFFPHAKLKEDQKKILLRKLPIP